MKRGKLFVISGPSGAGKGTICKLLAGEPETALSVSMTTRDPRTNETPGISYFFVTEEEFRRGIRENCFLEYAEVHGKLYGTPRLWVIEKLDEGLDVILEIDVQGALMVKDQFPDAVLVFIEPPSVEEMVRRMQARGSENQETMVRRIEAATAEMTYSKRYDYVVINDILDEAVDRVRSIILENRRS